MSSNRLQRLPWRKIEIRQSLGGGNAALGDERGLLEETAVANPQFTRALALKQQIVSTVKTDPENAGRLVKDWLQESGARQ